jgi:hypothetical protein
LAQGCGDGIQSRLQESRAQGRAVRLEVSRLTPTRSSDLGLGKALAEPYLARFDIFSPIGARPRLPTAMEVTRLPRGNRAIADVEFLERAWGLANDKARELGWIV